MAVWFRLLHPKPPKYALIAATHTSYRRLAPRTTVSPTSAQNPQTWIPRVRAQVATVRPTPAAMMARTVRRRSSWPRTSVMLTLLTRSAPRCTAHRSRPRTTPGRRVSRTRRLPSRRPPPSPRMEGLRMTRTAPRFATGQVTRTTLMHCRRTPLNWQAVRKQRRCSAERQIRAAMLRRRSRMS